MKAEEQNNISRPAPEAAPESRAVFAELKCRKRMRKFLKKTYLQQLASENNKAADQAKKELE